MMRKALFILALLVFGFGLSKNVFAGNASDAAQKYKYEYLFETDLPTEKFKDVFYVRLMSKYNWSPLGETNLKNDTYNSMWSFTDENKQKWECEVTIKRSSSEKVAVTLEMIPIVGS
jgi:hypothetical protein